MALKPLGQSKIAILLQTTLFINFQIIFLITQDTFPLIFQENGWLRRMMSNELHYIFDDS